MTGMDKVAQFALTMHLLSYLMKRKSYIRMLLSFLIIGIFQSDMYRQRHRSTESGKKKTQQLDGG